MLRVYIRKQESVKTFALILEMGQSCVLCKELSHYNRTWFANLQLQGSYTSFLEIN